MICKDNTSCDKASFVRVREDRIRSIDMPLLEMHPERKRRISFHTCFVNMYVPSVYLPSLSRTTLPVSNRSIRVRLEKLTI